MKPLRMLFFFVSCKQTAATYLHYLGWSHVCVNDSLSHILFLKNIIFVQYWTLCTGVPVFFKILVFRASDIFFSRREGRKKFLGEALTKEYLEPPRPPRFRPPCFYNIFIMLCMINFETFKSMYGIMYKALEWMYLV